jgi:hypothetical protein
VKDSYLFRMRRFMADDPGNHAFSGYVIFCAEMGPDTNVLHIEQNAQGYSCSIRRR